MQLLSVNVGLPREIEWNGKIVRTSIFKEPVIGRVRVTRLNVDGDQQSDLTVHGGPDKAVYAYPSEHYRFWRGELPDMDLAWGIFGENFTTDGLREDTLHVGDRLRVGSAEFVVTQPRMPCFKLGIRFNRSDMMKRFLQSGRTGFYLEVAIEGEIAAGDSIELLERDQHNISKTQRTKTCCVVPANYPHFQTAGESIFVSAFGVRTTDNGATLSGRGFALS